MHTKEFIEKMKKKHPIIVRRGLDIEKFSSTLHRANIIATMLGQELDYFNLNKKGYDYEGHKLIIKVTPTRHDGNIITIYFNKTLVLSSQKDIYIPGSWEKIVNAIYERMHLFLKEKKRRENTLDNVACILTRVQNNCDNVEISDNVKMKLSSKKEENPSGSDYIVTVIDIYENEKLVLTCYHNHSDDTLKATKYSVGLWEYTLNDYVLSLFNKEQEEFNEKSNELVEIELEKILSEMVTNLIKSQNPEPIVYMIKL